MYFYRRMDNTVVLLEYEKALRMYREDIEKYSLKGSSKQTKSVGKQSQRLIVGPPLGMESRHQQSVNPRCSMQISQ